MTDEDRRFTEFIETENELVPEERDTQFTDPDGATGLAKIVTNEGSGAYTITEVVYDTAGTAYITDTLGFSGETARDFQDRASGKVDDIVRYWIEEDNVGAIEILIDLGLGSRFTAKINSSSSAGTNQWSYPFAQVEKTGAAYANFGVMSGGVTGTAYNLAEFINSGSGVQGNGVDVANLTGTFALIACPTNSIVMIEIVRLTDGTIEYWFTHENGVDGACA